MGKPKIIEDLENIKSQLTDKAPKTRISVKDFGAKGDGITDDTSSLQQARDYITAQSQPSMLVFPAGIYKYSVSPNWAIQDAEIVTEGEVRLRYFGTDNAVIIDGIVGTHSNVYNMKFGQFIIEAPNTAKDGMYIKC